MKPKNADVLEGLGFHPWSTGGGMEALRKELVDGGYILLTNPEDPSIPNPTGPFMLGRYNADEEQIESKVFLTINELIRYIDGLS